ncbi:MAG TPA: type II secretion system protein [Bacillota bacterium]|nr:type II secretion system protein [Bacillota bacterium]
MFSSMKKFIKDQRGLTLIELLAVVVILGIISAIAIPSIGGLIDNSRRDAHVANARQMINAAKMAMSSRPDWVPTGTTTTVSLSLQQLEAGGYLERVVDPDTNTNTGYPGSWDGTAPTATTFFNPITPAATGQSYVTITANGANAASFTYSVKLVNATRGVQTAAHAAVDEDTIVRDSVINN